MAWSRCRTAGRRSRCSRSRPQPTAAYGGAVAEQTGGGRADLPALLALATQLANDASALLIDGLARARSSVTTKSTATDMVTEMDRAAEALIVDGHPRRASRRRHRGRGGNGRRRHERRALGRRPDRRHHQLTSMGSPGSACRSRPRSTATRLSAWCADPLRGEPLHRRRRAAARACNGGPHPRAPLSPTCRRRSSAPASRYDRRSPSSPGGGAARRSLPEVRDIRRFGAARSTSAMSRAAGSTATTRRASAVGTMPRARSSPLKPALGWAISTADRRRPTSCSPRQSASSSPFATSSVAPEQRALTREVTAAPTALDAAPLRGGNPHPHCRGRRAHPHCREDGARRRGLDRRGDGERRRRARGVRPRRRPTWS